MTVIDRERLSQWVEAELQRTGLSERQLAKKIRCNHATLQKWKNQKVGRLENDSISLLATYRTETPVQTRRWLEGVGDSLEDPLISAIREAPVHVVLRALEVGIVRVQIALGDFMQTCSVREFLSTEMRLRGLNPASLEDIRKFADYTTYIKPEEIEHLRQIIAGEIKPAREDIPKLAYGLTNFTGRTITERDLLLRSQH